MLPVAKFIKPMFKLIKTLSILILAIAVQAQTWPSGAIIDPSVGAPPPAEGELYISASTASLSNDHWKDSKNRVEFGIGLGKGLGLLASTSTRNLSGSGAFQQGIEDTRVGLAVWPLEAFNGKLRFGLNSNLILPTGFRTQEAFYDSTTQGLALLPSFTNDQTAGEILPGIVWTPGKAATLNMFGGLFSTSDKAEQAFRWGMGMKLNPFGEHVTAELGYSQSIIRAGLYPETEVLTAGVDIDLKWGLSVKPGFWAELEDDPMVGMGVGFSFTSRLPKSVFPPKAPAPVPVYRKGIVMVPPPLSDLPLAGINELWKELRQQVRPSFDNVIELESLDQPGLPYNDTERSRFWNSMNAIAAAYPNVQWLLITRVESEEVNRVSGLTIPLMVSQPTWEAACRLRFQLVDLFDMKSYGEQIVEVTAVRKDGLRLPIMGTIEKDVLSTDDSRELTFQAYRNVGREIALLLPENKK
jgi:hypothetical protein